jgi:hypothetical protein
MPREVTWPGIGYMSNGICVSMDYSINTRQPAFPCRAMSIPSCSKYISERQACMAAGSES